MTLMRTCIFAVFALIFVGTWKTPDAQPKYPKVAAEFPGASLKWVHIAEPEFQKRGINLDHYTVSVIEDDKTVDVSLISLDADRHASVRGSSGTYPGFAVEIDKAQKKVLSSSYVR